MGDVASPFNQYQKERWRINRTVTVGNLLVIGTICFAVMAGWYGYEKRLTAVEGITVGNRDLLDKMSPTLDRINESMSLLNQRLADYPLHRHVPGGVIYPSGSAPIVEQKSK